MDNNQFLQTILRSFNEFIKAGTSRSTAKLAPLHGSIAKDIVERLNSTAKPNSTYTAMSQGYGNGKEAVLNGRYVDKAVDITIFKNNNPIAGIAVKFVMQNYSQNSNNYFENMLGETANLRTNNYPYFQIFIIIDPHPYYKKSGNIDRWETFSQHHMNKYCKLSSDNPACYFHTPDKTLIYVVKIEPDISKDPKITDLNSYLNYYRTNTPSIALSGSSYSGLSSPSTVILNDYDDFANKVYHLISAI